MPPRSSAPRRAARPWRVLAQNFGLVLSCVVLLLAVLIYCAIYYAQLRALPGNFELTSTVNNTMPLVLAGLGQTIVILTRGLDLSVGGIIDLANALAALHLGDTAGSMALWTVIILAVGALLGSLNGALVAIGRLQPIVVTIATLSIFQGIAIMVLPQPGGTVAAGYSSALVDTSEPWALLYVLLFGVLWMAFRRCDLGVAVFAIGNDPAAAAANGIPVVRTRIAAYALSGAASAAAGPVPRRRRHGGRRHHGERLYAELDRRGGARRRQPVRRARQRHRRHRGRLPHDDDRQHPVLCQDRSALPVLLRGTIPAHRGRGRRWRSAGSSGGGDDARRAIRQAADPAGLVRRRPAPHPLCGGRGGGDLRGRRDRPARLRERRRHRSGAARCLLRRTGRGRADLRDPDRRHRPVDPLGLERGPRSCS